MRLTRKVVQMTLIGVTGLVVSGCAGLMEGAQSQLEIPSLEAQSNRVAVGMGIVRTNELMLNKIKISSDAAWPAAIEADITDEQKDMITQALLEDPYYATHEYTDDIQKQYLGGYYVAPVSAMTYRAFQKISVLYGNSSAWPSIYEFDGLDNFLDFRDGTLLKVEAVSGNSYDNLSRAVNALAPKNYRKKLQSASESLEKARNDVLKSKGDLSILETKLKVDEGKKEDKSDSAYVALTDDEISKIKTDMEQLETLIEDKEKIADEKQDVYFTLLDDAVEELKNEINLDDEETVRLAKNIGIAANEIQAGALEAGTMFTLALTNIATKSVIQNFSKELKSLQESVSNLPVDKRKFLEERIERLGTNALWLLPNLAMGSYYAITQANTAGKYESVSEVITEAYDLKVEAEKAAAEAKAQAEAEANSQVKTQS